MRQLVENIAQSVKYWFFSKSRIEEDGLISRDMIEAVMGMSKAVSNVWTLPFVSIAFISVAEESF